MGIFLNPNNNDFKRVLRSEIYVDKSEMIDKLNKLIGTYEPLICATRPRRFGKSITTHMLSAYYSKGADSLEIFNNLKIAKNDSFEKHLNKHNVLKFDMQSLFGYGLECSLKEKTYSPFYYLQKRIISDLVSNYPNIIDKDESSLAVSLQSINAKTGNTFIIIIDEWDSIFRNNENDENLQKEYIDFLRGIFKSADTLSCIDLAYITGILPIKKYGNQSALNNFNEFTMVNPKWMSQYIGFTSEEVETLCDKYSLDFSEVRRWYDGYLLKNQNDDNYMHVYNPNSVVQCSLNHKTESYWTSTETYKSLKSYIVMNFDGLKDAIIQLLGNMTIKINPLKFQNDMKSLDSKDDVLSLLVHLGYLGYNELESIVFIPNEEVRQEFVNAIEDTNWSSLIKIIDNSQKLLEATWNLDETLVCKTIEKVHEQNVSILNYNDENALSFIISLAYIGARKEYTLIRELPTGKSFCDIAFIPRKKSNKPALLIELKYNKNANGAIKQIKDKNYESSLDEYKDNLLLVGINYNKKTKKHECKIEKYE